MPESPAEALKTRLRTDLKAAMAGKDRSEAALLRTLIAAIDNAEAPALDGTAATAEIARLDLDPARLRAIIAGEIAEREQAAHALDSVGQAPRAAELRQQATLARRYL
ncbi:GatB/YqeY domain-containing protein [Pelagibacterium lacus]|uniref:GatB/YqeY domain-containing protein n=1 Tax=Pelagibacterium lacus TaxID=2282655 RepID=A0A369W8T9_9HYPH|nr:GatB/YqeY domain-containing protein [Pelagibacterium lacus]RDE10477.1 hypothetical protein DVH29_00555 [Pelagibacterium lacus]